MDLYTHMSERTHLHFVSNDKKHSGHVDNLSFYSGAEILISIQESQL